MKLFRIVPFFVALFVLAAFVSIGLWTTKQASDALHHASTNGKLQNEEEAEGAGSYLMRRRADPRTGEVNLKDVYKARRKAREQTLLKAEETVLEWESLGPTNVGGRTRALYISPVNPNKMIAGGVAGGLFVTSDGGVTWTDHPQNDELESLAIACFTRDADDNLYAGTGEGFYSFFGRAAGGVPGEGIMKSGDGGNTFEFLPATRPADPNVTSDGWCSINVIAAHPTISGYLYAAIGAENYTTANNGLQFSNDGGATWSIAAGTSTGIGYDVKAAADGTIHAIISNTYYRSSDGVNFEIMTSTNTGDNALPPLAGRKMLALAPSDNNTLYVCNSLNNECLDRVFQSKDGGDTWEVIGTGGGTPESWLSGEFEPMSGGSQCQGSYDMGLAVAADNPDMVYIAGVTLWRWTPQQGWDMKDNIWGFGSAYVHADKHGIVYHPSNANRMYVICDGGIFRTNNPAAGAPQFTPLNFGYNVTQFYAVAADWEGAVMGGAQDNGTQLVNYQDPTSPLDAEQVHGSDGGFVDFARTRPGYLFAESQNGFLVRSTNNGDSFNDFLDDNIDADDNGSVDGGTEFIAPFILWEDIDKYIDENLRINKFVTGSETGQIWMTEQALQSGMPTWKNIATFSGGGNTVSCVAVSKRGNEIIAGSSGGKIMRIKMTATDTTLKEMDSDYFPGALNGRYVSSVAFAPTSSGGTVYVTMGNYGYDHYVYRSTNAMAANPVFTSIQSNLPPMPVYDIVVDKDNINRVFAATEMGIWMYDVSTGEWAPQNAGIGNVPVFRIRQEPMRDRLCNVLYIGTHGRGFYRSRTLTYSACDTDVITANDTPTGVTVNTLSMRLFGVPLAEQGVVEVSLPTASGLALSLYDLRGNLVWQSQYGLQHGGRHQYPIYRNHLAAGLYVCVAEAGGSRVSQKLLVQ